MGGWILCFVLLLPMTVCIEASPVKTSESSSYMSPVCTNETLNVIMLIICKISTERRGEEECRLTYRHDGHDFVHECDSRFTFVTKNQTVFLHLSSLTPEDSGNYTCECSRPDGTIIFHQNITVEGEGPSSPAEMGVPFILIGATTVIVITGVILGFIYRGLSHGQRPEPQSSRPSKEPEDIEPYSTFLRRESGLYSTVKICSSNVNTNTNLLTTEGMNIALFEEHDINSVPI
ncbi:uncharacterized protein LOC117152613 [Mastacembelus armatus]|uniref:uncharacterized protein LOC117152613 n=1 Tax=Mastacembelus armatus TaxID=205130 RepID=UPI000E45F5E1|nr:uncharacterized protein LOC117152613 [Mastacembelus armatus]